MIHFILKQMLCQMSHSINCLFLALEYKRESRVTSSDEDTYNYKFVR